MTRIRISSISLAIVLLPADGSSFNGSDVAAINWPKTLAMVRKDFPEIHQLGTAELAAWLADGDRPQPAILDTRQPQV